LTAGCESKACCLLQRERDRRPVDEDMRGRSLDVAGRFASLVGCLLRRERVECDVDEEDMRGKEVSGRGWHELYICETCLSSRDGLESGRSFSGHFQSHDCPFLSVASFSERNIPAQIWEE